VDKPKAIARSIPEVRYGFWFIDFVTSFYFPETKNKKISTT
jgi:hypothetical protein